MLIRHKGTTWIGLLLSVSFLGVLVLIFSPVFGQGRNGLQFSDQLFNKLAKGSSYFVPELVAQLKGVEKQKLAVSIEMKDANEAARALKIFSRPAPETTAQGAVLNVRGNLAKLLGAVVQDSSSMYFNKGGEIREKYGMDEREVMLIWHHSLNLAAKELQKNMSIAQAKMILDVVARGIEPAYNFYQVEPEGIGDKALLATSLLVFYLVYTLWWGFAIFFLFDGIGLSMTKAKVKREV